MPLRFQDKILLLLFKKRRIDRYKRVKALLRLIGSLKEDSIWDKIEVFYPGPGFKSVTL